MKLRLIKANDKLFSLNEYLNYYLALAVANTSNSFKIGQYRDINKETANIIKTNLCSAIDRLDLVLVEQQKKVITIKQVNKAITKAEKELTK